MNGIKKSFWKNATFWTIISLVFFTPIGLFLLWYYKKEWNKNVKIIITVVSSLFFVYALSQSNTQAVKVNTNTSVTKKSNDEIKKKADEENKKAEEQARVEAEQKKAEEQVRVETEKKKAEEQARVEAEQKKAEEQAKRTEATQNTQVGAPKEHYASCKEMKKVHPKGAKKGDAWYDERLDGDHDGYACE